MSPPVIGLIVGVAAVSLVLLVTVFRGTSRRRGLRQRLTAIAARLGDDPEAADRARTEEALGRLERASDAAAEAVAEASSDAIRLRKALDSLPLAVVVCTEGGHVVFRNSGAEALMGGRHSDALAAKVVDEMITSTWAGEPASQRTLELYGPPRRTLNVHTHTVDDGQRSLGVIAVIEDVSDKRRLEAVRRDFVANVSHELKTPAAALGLLAETLMSETDPTVTTRLASRIQTEAFRVSGIIDELLDLSRIEAEESPPRELVLTDLVMAESIERARHAAETHGVELVLKEAAAPVAVMGDRRQLISAIGNLLDNAVKYSDPGTTVEVSTTNRNGHVDMIVADQGIGIPAPDLERIFERFYRVDRGRSRNTGGTGLGLSIVRHIASNHNGTVLVESREGEGSRFTLRLPLRRDRDQ